MRISNIKNMSNGWLVGNFSPAVHKTSDFEVAYHQHKKGCLTQDHYHKQSIEINLIISGKMNVNDTILMTGDIFIFDPYDKSRIDFLEDTQLMVIRTKSIPGDKFFS